MKYANVWTLLRANWALSQALLMRLAGIITFRLNLFVLQARHAHVRYAHMSPSELAKVIVSGARADMPKYTACCSIHESYGAMALYLL